MRQGPWVGSRAVCTLKRTGGPQAQVQIPARLFPLCNPGKSLEHLGPPFLSGNRRLSPQAAVRTKEQNRSISADGGIAGLGPRVLEPACRWSPAASRHLRPPLSRSILSLFWEQKEILLHVLNYIQFLQKSIDVAKALLELHTTAGKGGLGGE